MIPVTNTLSDKSYEGNPHKLQYQPVLHVAAAHTAENATCLFETNASHAQRTGYG